MTIFERRNKMYTPKKILIAEDDPNIRTLMEEALNKTYEIISVDNGFSAYTKAKEEAVGLIILDLFLPRMDGLTVCRKLKSEEQTNNIPILIVSAYNKKELIVALLKLGIKHFLAKPFDMNIFIKRVDELFIPPAISQKFTNLKIKYSLNKDILNVKLVGELVSHDFPVLINDINNQVKGDINKIILHLNDLNSFGMDQLNIIEQLKDHFLENKINFKITAGGSNNLRANLLKNSALKENLLTT